MNQPQLPEWERSLVDEAIREAERRYLEESREARERARGSGGTGQSTPPPRQWWRSTGPYRRAATWRDSSPFFRAIPRCSTIPPSGENLPAPNGVLQACPASPAALRI
jgi:hypothetical protein